jgi:D-sedoheptulose 7-phosphate isomerase
MTNGLESLYPFLYEGAVDERARRAGELRQAVRRSAIDKLTEVQALRRQVLADAATALVRCAQAMAAAFGRGGTLFTFGNGGSSTDAEAIARWFRTAGTCGLPAVALTSHTAVVTALANDIGFDRGLARQLAALAGPADVALGLSTSGSSDNLIECFTTAHRLGLLTVGFAGHHGGRMAAGHLVEHLFVVPSASVHRVQEAQATLYQVLGRLTVDACENLPSGPALTATGG